jgi:hypothetical protein
MKDLATEQTNIPDIKKAPEGAFFPNDSAYAETT